MKNYIDETEFTCDILIAQKNELTEKLQLDIFKICININKIFKNINTQDRCDMILESFLQVVLNYKYFNYYRFQNAFTYISQIIKNSQKRTLLKLHNKKYQKISKNGFDYKKINFIEFNKYEKSDYLNDDSYD